MTRGLLSETGGGRGRREPGRAVARSTRADAGRGVGVSIIVPVHNAKPHLSDCLKSLTRQSFDDFEVILVDDGSTDGSTRICRGYARRRANFRMIRQENAGAGPARNRGLEIARGKYIAFIDADDEVDTDYLEQLWEKAERHRADLVVCKYRVEFTDTGSGQGMFESDKRLWQRFRPHCFSNELTPQDRAALLSMINYPWNKLYKRTLLIHQRIEFPATPVHNDIPVHWKSIIGARRIVLQDRTLYTHRKFSGEKQLTNIFDRRRLALFDTLDLVERAVERAEQAHLYLPTFVSFKVDMIFWARPRMKRELLPDFDRRVAASLSRIDWPDLVAYYRSRHPSWKRRREIEHYINSHWFRRSRDRLAGLLGRRRWGVGEVLRGLFG